MIKNSVFIIISCAVVARGRTVQADGASMPSVGLSFFSIFFNGQPRFGALLVLSGIFDILGSFSQPHFPLLSVNPHPYEFPRAQCVLSIYCTVRYSTLVHVQYGRCSTILEHCGQHGLSTVPYILYSKPVNLLFYQCLIMILRLYT